MLVLAVIGLGAAGYVAVGPPASAKAVTTTATVRRGSVLSSVSATGNVSPSTQLSLSFGSSGIVTEIDVAPGQHVDAGQILAKVDNRTQQATLTSAKQALASAQAKLDQDQGGATPQVVAQDQASANQAQVALNGADQGVSNAQATAPVDAQTLQSAIDAAKQSLTDAQAAAGVDATNLSTSVGQAKQSLTDAQTAAATDATNLSAAVAQAQQSLTGAQAAAGADATNLSAAVAQAQQSLTGAQAAAGADATNLAQAVTNAQAQPAADNQQLSNDQSRLSADSAPCSTTTTSTTSTTTAPGGSGGGGSGGGGSASGGGSGGGGSGGGGSASGGQATCPSQSQIQADQDKVTADQAKLIQDQNAITTAQDNQAAGRVKDQQSLDAATNAVQNAQDNQAAGTVKDSQAVDTATNAVQNAQDNLPVGQLKDQQAIDTATNTVNNAQNSLQSGQLKDTQALTTAQQQVQAATASLQSTIASNAAKEVQPPSTIAADQSSVANADSQMTSAQITYDETVLSAPVEGTVSVISGKVGQSAGGGSAASTSGGSSTPSGGGTTSGSSSTASAGSSGSGFLTLTDLTSLQVVAGYSETDAAKIHLGQPATVSFAALPNQNLQGSVSAIDTTSTVVSNVVTYNVTVSIVNAPPSLKPGMTATVAVTTSKKDNVLTLPTSAVTARGTTGTVSVLQPDGKTTVARPVVLGLRGDTAVEVVSGLSAGDKVVTSLGGGTRTGTAGTTRAVTGGGLGGGGVGGGGFGGGGGGGGRAGG